MDLIARWRSLSDEIQELTEKYHLSTLPTLIAVSKYASIEQIRTLHNAGQKDFAENYWQMAKNKIEFLKKTNIIWHFIGALQSNKCKFIAQNFSWVHTLISPKHALLLNQERQFLPPLNVNIQINFHPDNKRYGASIESLSTVLKTVLTCANLKLNGLMVMPEKNQYNDFISLAKLRNKLENEWNISLPVLCMGMSNDYQEALSAGATMLRIGSKLFEEA